MDERGRDQPVGKGRALRLSHHDPRREWLTRGSRALLQYVSDGFEAIDDYALKDLHPEVQQGGVSKECSQRAEAVISSQNAAYARRAAGELRAFAKAEGSPRASQPLSYSGVDLAEEVLGRRFA